MMAVHLDLRVMISILLFDSETTSSYTLIMVGSLSVLIEAWK